MRSVQEWDISDLEALCQAKIEESSSLEFKNSSALRKAGNRNSELCKDVSAMANAAGGLIIYGISEGQLGEADSIDIGSDSCMIKSEHIGQILRNGIEPIIQNISIHTIKLQNGNNVFLIDVPQATIFAPHQAKEYKRYYRRVDKNVEPMLDHEIKDIMRRNSTPHLYLTFDAYKKEEKIFLKCFIGNYSSEPALYSMVNLALADSIGITFIEQTEKSEIKHYFQSPEGFQPSTMFSKKMAIPNHFPIFKEQRWIIFDVETSIAPNISYIFQYSITCPGFFGVEQGRFRWSNEQLQTEFLVSP